MKKSELMLYREQTSDPSALGFDPAGLDRIVEVFERMIAEGAHPGAQLAIRRDRQPVLHIGAGEADRTGKPVTPNTLFQIRSITKALAAMVIFVLRDRGQLSFNEPVVRYWPEFGQNGKETTTLAQVMGHRAGIPDLPLSPEEIKRGRAGNAPLVAALAPIWTPGTTNGYHAATYGWILDEIVPRCSGRELHEVLRTDILKPLGVRDVYLGLPEAEFPRMAKMLVDERVRASQGRRAQTSDLINTFDGIRLPLSYAFGVATAAALAEAFDVFAFEGAVDGRAYFSAETQAIASRPTNEANVVDLRLEHPIRWGYGVILDTTPDIYGTPPHRGAIGHAGGGASVAWADPSNRLSVAFLTNRMAPRAESWLRYRLMGDAIYEAMMPR